MADETTPNQGATGETTESLGPSSVGSGPPAAAAAAQTGPNQGATGDAPTATEVPPPPAAEASTGGGESPLAAQREAAAGVLDEHPEIVVGSAFLGGFVVAKLLKRLGGSS